MPIPLPDTKATFSENKFGQKQLFHCESLVPEAVVKKDLFCAFSILVSPIVTVCA